MGLEGGRNNWGKDIRMGIGLNCEGQVKEGKEDIKGKNGCNLVQVLTVT